ncbi:MAG: hypothetical protein AB1806_15295 [Acidobacteriota bacterium]
MMRYGLQEERFGEEFFEGRVRILRESVEERLSQMKHRERVHVQILDEIGRERDDRERRLRMFPYTESAVRTTLMRQVDSLGKEARSELRAFAKDTAQLGHDAREKLEEYEGMLELFNALAVTKRGREGP